MAVTHRDPAWIVTTLRPNDLVDLLFHQLGENAEPDAHRQGNAAGQSGYTLVIDNGGPLDISAYRSVTLYVHFLQSGQACNVLTELPPSGSQHFLILASFDTTSTGTTYVKTFDPAPPNMMVLCYSDTQSFDTDWELAGRTG